MSIFMKLICETYYTSSPFPVPPCIPDAVCQQAAAAASCQQQSFLSLWRQETPSIDKGIVKHSAAYGAPVPFSSFFLPVVCD